MWSLLVWASVILSVICSIVVKMTFVKYNNIRPKSGVTAEQAARSILDAYGLYHVQIQNISGTLSDNYDPKTNIVSLSEGKSVSIGAIAVAAHEVGHAIQHSEEYMPVVFRTMLAPVVGIASRAWIFVFLAGAVLGMAQLYLLGILIFGIVLVFQLLTLPVEFNASARALQIMRSDNFLDSTEIKGAKKVLTAAALTYIASVLVTLMQLLRMLSRRR